MTYPTKAQLRSDLIPDTDLNEERLTIYQLIHRCVYSRKLEIDFEDKNKSCSLHDPAITPINVDFERHPECGAVVKYLTNEFDWCTYDTSQTIHKASIKQPLGYIIEHFGPYFDYFRANFPDKSLVLPSTSIISDELAAQRRLSDKTLTKAQVSEDPAHTNVIISSIQRIQIKGHQGDAPLAAEEGLTTTQQQQLPQHTPIPQPTISISTSESNIPSQLQPHLQTDSQIEDQPEPHIRPQVPPKKEHGPDTPPPSSSTSLFSFPWSSMFFRSTDLDRDLDVDFVNAQYLSYYSTLQLPLLQKHIHYIRSIFGLYAKSGTKSIDGIYSKSKRSTILENEPWYDVQYIRDALRAKIRINSIQDIKPILAFFLIHGYTIVQADYDKFTQPKGFWGWRPIAFDLRAPTDDRMVVDSFESAHDLDGFNDIFDQHHHTGNKPGQDSFFGPSSQTMSGLRKRDKARSIFQAFLDKGLRHTRLFIDHLRTLLVRNVLGHAWEQSFRHFFGHTLEPFLENLSRQFSFWVRSNSWVSSITDSVGWFWRNWKVMMSGEEEDASLTLNHNHQDDKQKDQPTPPTPAPPPSPSPPLSVGSQLQYGTTEGGHANNPSSNNKDTLNTNNDIGSPKKNDPKSSLQNSSSPSSSPPPPPSNPNPNANTGFIIELYFVPYHMDLKETKGNNHHLYEKWRNMPLLPIFQSHLQRKHDSINWKNQYGADLSRFRRTLKMEGNLGTSDEENNGETKKQSLLEYLTPRSQDQILHSIQQDIDAMNSSPKVNNSDIGLSSNPLLAQHQRQQNRGDDQNQPESLAASTNLYSIDRLRELWIDFQNDVFTSSMSYSNALEQWALGNRIGDDYCWNDQLGQVEKKPSRCSPHGLEPTNSPTGCHGFPQQHHHPHPIPHLIPSSPPLHHHNIGTISGLEHAFDHYVNSNLRQCSDECQNEWLSRARLDQIRYPKRNFS